LETPVIGVAFDGTGLGSDGYIWGGEFLVINEEDWYNDKEKIKGIIKVFLND